VPDPATAAGGVRPQRQRVAVLAAGHRGVGPPFLPRHAASHTSWVDGWAGAEQGWRIHVTKSRRRQSTRQGQPASHRQPATCIANTDTHRKPWTPTHPHPGTRGSRQSKAGTDSNKQFHTHAVTDSNLRPQPVCHLRQQAGSQTRPQPWQLQEWQGTDCEMNSPPPPPPGQPPPEVATQRLQGAPHSVLKRGARGGRGPPRPGPGTGPTPGGREGARAGAGSKQGQGRRVGQGRCYHTGAAGVAAGVVAGVAVGRRRAAGRA
jgi:hypothetical protein